MFLTELTVHNVGPYRGRQTIDLRTSPDRPVVLIGGLNGCGKTTLLDSLQLALYGNRARVSNRGSQAYEDYLAATVSRGVDLADGASVSLKFQIDAEDGVREYEVTRSWAASGKRIREVLDVSVDGVWDKALSATWADHVEDLLPLEIAGLFFFDGEKIEALADPERAATVIQTAIHSLLGASTIEQLRTDLSALQRKQVPDSGNARLEQEYEDLRAHYQSAREEGDQAQARLSTVREEQKSASKALQKAEHAFAAEGGDAYQQRGEFEAALRSLTAHKHSLESQLRGLAEGALPLALVLPQLQMAEEQASKESEADRAAESVRTLEDRDSWLLQLVPAELRPSLTVELESDRARRTAESAIPRVLSLALGQVGSLTALRVQASADLDTARGMLGDMATTRSEIDRLTAVLDQVPSDERIKGLQEALERHRSICSRLEGQALVLSEDVERCERNVADIGARLGRVESERLLAGVADDDRRRIIEHSERVRETLAELREKLIQRNIGRVEIATLEAFRHLMRKKGLVRDLRIDPKTYAISLSDRNGNEVPPGRLSAGERQLLAVALLWGLARVAGNQLPSVIDTPLGRLDSVHRMQLVQRYFPNAGRQVLLLSTDEEIDEQLLPSLASAIAQTYLLEHDVDADSTAITPGYWWDLEADFVA